MSVKKQIGRMTGLWVALDKLNRILILIIASLVLILYGAFWLIGKLALNREVTVKIPPGVYTDISITVGNNETYIKHWGKDFIKTIAEYSPHNYEAKANYLLRYASSKGDKKIRPKLLQEYEEVKKNNTYQEFHSNEKWKTTWLTRTLWRVEVEGEVVRESSVLSQLTRNKKNCLYYVDITYDKDGIRLEDFGYVEK